MSNTKNNHRVVVICVYLFVYDEGLWYANKYFGNKHCIASSLSNSRALATLSNGKQQQCYGNDLFIQFIVIFLCFF